MFQYFYVGFYIGFSVLLFGFFLAYVRFAKCLHAHKKKIPLNDEEKKRVDEWSTKGYKAVMFGGVFGPIMAMDQFFCTGFWHIPKWMLIFTVCLIFLTSMFAFSMSLVADGKMESGALYYMVVIPMATIVSVGVIILGIAVSLFTYAVLTALFLNGPAWPEFSVSDMGPYGGHSPVWYSTHVHRAIDEAKWCGGSYERMNTVHSCYEMFLGLKIVRRNLFEGKYGQYGQISPP